MKRAKTISVKSVRGICRASKAGIAVEKPITFNIKGRNRLRAKRILQSTKKRCRITISNHIRNSRFSV